MEGKVLGYMRFLLTDWNLPSETTKLRTEIEMLRYQSFMQSAYWDLYFSFQGGSSVIENSGSQYLLEMCLHFSFGLWSCLCTTGFAVFEMSFISMRASAIFLGDSSQVVSSHSGSCTPLLTPLFDLLTFLDPFSGWDCFLVSLSCSLCGLLSDTSAHWKTLGLISRSHGHFSLAPLSVLHLPPLSIWLSDSQYFSH